MSCHFIDFESINDATKANIEAFYPLLLIHMKNSRINIKKNKVNKDYQININKKRVVKYFITIYKSTFLNPYPTIKINELSISM